MHIRFLCRHAAARPYRIVRNRLWYSGGGPKQSTQTRDERNVTMALYATAGAVAVMGLSYAAVPLYQMFCQHYGVGGTTQVATAEQFKNVRPVAGVRAAPPKPRIAGRFP
jgi:hypothetical protein